MQSVPRRRFSRFQSSWLQGAQQQRCCPSFLNTNKYWRWRINNLLISDLGKFFCLSPCELFDSFCSEFCCQVAGSILTLNIWISFVSASEYLLGVPSSICFFSQASECNPSKSDTLLKVDRRRIRAFCTIVQWASQSRKWHLTSGKMSKNSSQLLSEWCQFLKSTSN